MTENRFPDLGGFVKTLIFITTFLITIIALADSFDLVKDGKTYTCTSDDSSNYSPEFPSCAEVSMKKWNYVTSDCHKVQNNAQDICAGYSIEKWNYVTSDCFKLEGGGRCAITSFKKWNYITSDCFKIKNSRQDRCAVTSIEKWNYVTSDCFNL